MKIIYLMRHAKTESENHALNDKERNLTETGISEATQMADVMRKKDWIPQTILCSTANRTKATCKLVSDKLDILPERIEYLDSIYLSHTEDLFHLIQKIDNHYDAAMIIGHNPSITHAPFLLAQSLIDHVPTAGILRIEFSQEHWSDITIGSGKLVGMEHPMKILY